MRIHLGAGVGLLLISCGADGSTPPESSPLPPNTAVVAPDGRSAHSMVYDEARGVVVLFGGSGNTLFGDTWTWDGTRWRQAATTGPSPRNGPVLVYDATRRVVVLHGGRAGPTLLTDTWEWNGVTWTQRAGAGPPSRIHAAGGYDRRRQRVVLFGGVAPNDSALFDTWEWDGNAWTRAMEGGPDRWANALVYDATGDRLLLHAIERGRGRGVYRTELYAWTGSAWNLVGAALSGPEISPTQAIAGLNTGILLFDGGTQQGSASTWRWSVDAWTRLDAATTPALRNGHAMAYDPVRNRVVLFGGFRSQQDFRDTWEWTGQAWIEVNSTGVP